MECPDSNMKISGTYAKDNFGKTKNFHYDTYYHAHSEQIHGKQTIVNVYKVNDGVI